MQRLIDGYARFRKNVFPQNSKLFEKLAKGQSPQALFIGCSDSRVMPEMIMQCEPGDLFPCRNAGNLVPPASDTTSGVAATVEYAVRVLHVPDVIVCGHTDCGAIKGMLHHEELTQTPMVRSWLEHVGPGSRWLRGVLHASTKLSFEQKVQVMAEANVITQMQNLTAYPAVAEALQAGTIRIHGWMYDIGHGSLRRFDPDAGEFCALLGESHAVPSVIAQPELKTA